MLCVNINIPFKTIHRIPSTSGFEIQHILASLQDIKQRIETANKQSIGKINHMKYMSGPYPSTGHSYIFLQMVNSPSKRNILWQSS